MYSCKNVPKTTFTIPRGECQNPYNHNPYCVEILIGFVEILIGFVEILIGLLEILIGQFRDFDCRDFDIDPTVVPQSSVFGVYVLSYVHPLCS